MMFLIINDWCVYHFSACKTRICDSLNKRLLSSYNVTTPYLCRLTLNHCSDVTSQVSLSVLARYLYHNFKTKKYAITRMLQFHDTEDVNQS